MKTLCYNLDNTIPCGMALNTIAMKIPCFIDIKPINNFHKEVAIQCREADAAYVELMLAEFV